MTAGYIARVLFHEDTVEHCHSEPKLEWSDVVLDPSHSVVIEEPLRRWSSPGAADTSDSSHGGAWGAIHAQ